jgi:uncharacterized protein YecT (DUF1311 family)
MNASASLTLAITLIAVAPATSGGSDSKEEIMVWDGMPLRRSCDKNTITINECAHAVWKQADDELNAVYQEQLRYLRGTEAKFPPGRGASKKLIAAQRAWLAFRDRDCEYQLGEPGGSGDTFQTLKCMYKRTLTRTTELREYVACRVNGCPF